MNESTIPIKTCDLKPGMRVRSPNHGRVKVMSTSKQPYKDLMCVKVSDQECKTMVWEASPNFSWEVYLV